ncbi:MAG: phenazine biosynthesis protein PhzF [Actinomycetota bacterium]|nr:MAG: phenazine biosynthesis protein PhzF [Actinomycetota bacterium]
MMRVPFRLVDVFCERPFQGNQLCVVPEAAGLDAETMQLLAREIGFSETTFVTQAEGDRYAMRIFTPGTELPFAGHPSLGTAYVLVAEERISSPATQVVAEGEFRVEVDLLAGRARMRQLPPSFGPRLEDRELAARAAGLAPTDLRGDLPLEVVSTGLPHLIVPVRDLDALRRARRDGELVPRVCREVGAGSMYLFTETVEGVTARMFDPELGIGEDPATGSAAGPLGAYLARHGLLGVPGAVRIRQGEQVGRPSLLEVEVASEGGLYRIEVAGGVAIVGEGVFRLDAGVPSGRGA